jgi:mono/diheme cytochrome c family protein
MKILISILFIIVLATCSSQVRPPGEEQEFSQEAQKGQVVFMKHCNICHPAGRAGLGPGIFNKPLPRSAIRFQVRNGIGVMPAFSKEHISEEELDWLVKFIKEN